MAYEIDPDDRATWRNWPKPAIAPWISEQITKVGGFHSSGKPNLRLVWMPEVLRYFAGKDWPYYINTSLNPLIHTVHRLVRIVHDEFGTVLLDANGKPREEARFAPDLETAQEVLKLDRIHREGWKYMPYAKEEYICTQRWAVEEFIPIEMWEEAGFISPQTWERDRYGEFEDPITDVVTQNCDLLGPYPAPGRYEVMLVCEEKVYDDDKGEVIATRYRAPGAWLLEDLRKAMEERARFSGTPAAKMTWMKERARAIDMARQKKREGLREEMLDAVKGWAWQASDKIARVYQNGGKTPKPKAPSPGNIGQRIVAAS